MLYLVVVNFSIIGSIFCDSDDEGDSVVSSTNNEKSSKETDVVRVTENKKNDSFTIEVNKKIVESAIEKGPEIVVDGIKDVAPKLGIAAAAGKVAAETVKQTAGMAPVPRLLVVGAAALITATGTSLGIELGKAASENITKRDERNK